MGAFNWVVLEYNVGYSIQRHLKYKFSLIKLLIAFVFLNIEVIARNDWITKLGSLVLFTTGCIVHFSRWKPSPPRCPPSSSLPTATMAKFFAWPRFLPASSARKDSRLTSGASRCVPVTFYRLLVHRESKLIVSKSTLDKWSIFGNKIYVLGGAE